MTILDYTSRIAILPQIFFVVVVVVVVVVLVKKRVFSVHEKTCERKDKNNACIFRDLMCFSTNRQMWLLLFIGY